MEGRKVFYRKFFRNVNHQPIVIIIIRDMIGCMRIEFGKDPTTHKITASVEIDDIDLVVSEIPRAVREWYDSLEERKMSDEIFYLSEIIKWLE